MKQIISASRRTDIPAYYGHWFMERIRQGWVGVVNPFNAAKYSVLLRPDDVFFIVFWSKNYEPFLSSLEELDRMGYKFYFQFTITGNPEIFEPGVPGWKKTVETAKRLADRFSPEHVLWRFDPIVLSSVTPAAEVLDRFDQLSEAMEGSTVRCYISIVQYYRKILKAARKLNADEGLEFLVSEEELEKIVSIMPDAAGAFRASIGVNEKKQLAQEIAAIAMSRGIGTYSCCCDFLEQGGKTPVYRASCIDGELIEKLVCEKLIIKQGPTRENCECVESRDIGAYDTCPHGCVYCYANSNREMAESNYKKIMTADGPHSMKIKYGNDEFSPPEGGQGDLF